MRQCFLSNKIMLSFLGVSLALSQTLLAATQADKVNNQTFQTPSHQFSNQEVWDSKSQTFKEINGTNYYGISKAGLVSGITLEVFNPKNPNQSLQESKLNILTPNQSLQEILEVQGTHTANSQNKNLHSIQILPFLVAGNSLKGDCINNKLLIKEAELSSVVFLKPTHIKTKNPPKKEIESKINYIIAAGVAKEGNAKNNALELQKGSYINMGVENTYSLKLNGAPYVVGGIAILGDAIGNSLSAKSGSRVDIHTAPFYKNEMGKFVFDERITHLVGGLAYNGNVRENKLNLNGVELMIHAPSGLYSSFASAHITGAFIDGDGKKAHHAIKNTLVIDEFLLGLRVDGNPPLFYDAIFLGEFFGGKTTRGNANENYIALKNVPSIGRMDKNVKVQGIYEFFAGYTLNGKANANVLDVALKSPLQVSNSYFRQNAFGFYGAFASEGASHNTIKIRNNLTIIDGTKNPNDRVNIIAGRTLAGEANSNVIDFKDSQVSLPLFVYATTQENFEGSIHYPEYAKHNKISLNNVFGRKDIRSGVEAMSVENNQIFYHNVEAQSSGEGADKESSVYIRATNLAVNNLFKASNYWATSMLNVYGIRGEEESKNNQMIFNNVGFNTDKIAMGSGLILIGGVGKSAYHNLLSIQDLEIGAYDKEKDFIYIAASAIPDANSNLALSYDNTLYIGGNISIHKQTLLNALSGSVIRVPSYTNNKADIITLPAPSLAQLTDDNHLILEQPLRARVVNNFEHYSLIYHSNNQDKPLVESLETPINLSSESQITLLLKKGEKAPKKGSKVALISSQNGFSDINGNTMNEAQLNQLLERISKNPKTLDYKKIPQLKQENLRVIPLTLSLGNEGRVIYGEI
ncbi:hypothetical protein NCR96_03920 [Helicobacter sp. 14348-15]|uniref:hypothetical protein n=1 Tax=Helicobacter colisuis TaxID=2949739 RepID=UPI00202B9CC0|nr:hypothetical protein [Helicobacter colisuis]MCL9820889.1 hypothetical protein [Helicobacter colisuis]